MAPFYGWGSTATSRRQFYHQVPRNPWYSFCQPWKDEKLSQLLSHPVVLNMRSLDWESSALATRPMLWNLALKVSNDDDDDDDDDDDELFL